MSVNLAG